MTVKITVRGSRALADGPLPFGFVQVIARLSGRKTWNGTRSVEFESSMANIETVKRHWEDTEWIDASGDLAAAEELAMLATQHAAEDIKNVLTGSYTPANELRKYQADSLNLCAYRESYAWLWEMGLGKTAVCIANAGLLYSEGKITGMLVLAPKGVHGQWVNEEIPKHFDKRIADKVNAVEWTGKKVEASEWKPGMFNVLAMNIDAVRTEKGYQTAHDFLNVHHGRSMMVIDESHTIKSPKAKRTKMCWALGGMAEFRRIMTGTPISRNIPDAWSQFKFLNQKILGHAYVTSFTKRYCVMGGFEGRQIIGSKNVEEFYTKIAPHAHRLKKDDVLDLPPKIYIERVFELDDNSMRHYKTMKTAMLAALDSGEIVDAGTAVVAMIRLQQISCGYLPKEDGELEHLGDARIEAMLDVVSQREGPIIIWARFRRDIEMIEAALKKYDPKAGVVTYYGGTRTKDRKEAVRKFLSGEARYFVSNPAAGGTGLNLQGDCGTTIYFSNSFNALERWQSESRVHRLGTRTDVTYFDLIARGTVDRAILANLKKKQDLSSLALDDIRRAVESA